MIASPLVLINGMPQINGINVAANSTVTISLASSAGVFDWNIACIGTDDLNTTAAVNATLVVDYSSNTATFVSPYTNGSSLIFQSIVNKGTDVNGVVQTQYGCTFGVYVLTNEFLRLGSQNETLEGNIDYGWLTKFNQMLRTRPPTGFQGPTGLPGATGNTGAKGTDGYVGATGSQGPPNAGTIAPFMTMLLTPGTYSNGSGNLSVPLTSFYTNSSTMHQISPTEVQIIVPVAPYYYRVTLCVLYTSNSLYTGLQIAVNETSFQNAYVPGSSLQVPVYGQFIGEFPGSNLTITFDTGGNPGDSYTILPYSTITVEKLA